MQLVEPHNHRVDAAERAIQTFKNHTIAGLSIVDEEFPSMLDLYAKLEHYTVYLSSFSSRVTYFLT
eukprot:scaffold227432_cov49-Attheya_sp.AAC.1